jgi:hypothetical protein
MRNMGSLAELPVWHSIHPPKLDGTITKVVKKERRKRQGTQNECGGKRAILTSVNIEDVEKSGYEKFEEKNAEINNDREKLC